MLKNNLNQSYCFVKASENKKDIEKLSSITKNFGDSLNKINSNNDKINELQNSLEKLSNEKSKLSNSMIKKFNKLEKKYKDKIHENIELVQNFLEDYLNDSLFNTPIQNSNETIKNTEIIENKDISSVKTQIFEEKIFENEVLKKETIETNTKDSSKIEAETKLVDNNTLVISETKGKVFLPYKISDLEKKVGKKAKIEEIEKLINEEYVVPIRKYKNPTASRFKETFELMRHKEKSTPFQAINLALELSTNSLLNPAVISACKNLNELDTYLDYLDNNALDEFKIFDIKYEVFPAKL